MHRAGSKVSGVRRAQATTLLAAVLALVAAAPARSEIPPGDTIAGPSTDVIDLGGVAMAGDGTGGLVYRARENGRAHIFVARFADGKWQPSQRIDGGQAFDSSWPAIGAGDGGRLVVVWVQEFGAGTDRLFSATLDPGAQRFQSPVPIDLNVGEATATRPAIAMNAGGQAYLAYRYLPDVNRDPTLPEGYVNADVRVQRYNGSFWSAAGQPADRNTATPVREPTAGNSPKVGIDVNGQGLVVWQEPDDDFIDRIYARRLFGGTFGIPLLVSPQTFGDRPLRGPADSFSVDEAGFGEGAVVFRQQPGANSPIAGTRTMLNTIPESFSESARAFRGPVLLDGPADTRPADEPGRGGVGIAPKGDFIATFGLGTATFAAIGNDAGVQPPVRLDTTESSVSPDPLVDLAPTGAAAVAWKTGDDRRGAVIAREARSDGIGRDRSLSGSRGGVVGDLRMSGSGLGDALVAFTQGSGEFAQIVAGTIDAPPSGFAVNTPVGFVNDSKLKLSWEPAFNAVGRVTYTPKLDDEPVAQNVAQTKVAVDLEDFDDGVLSLQVIAADPRGQETESLAGELKIDRRVPRARVTGPKRRRVHLRVVDGPVTSTSGVAPEATTITWGDGKRTRRRASATHVYSRGGRFRIRVRTADKAGNRTTITRSVRVR